MNNRRWISSVILTVTCLALVGFTVHSTLLTTEASTDTQTSASCQESYNASFGIHPGGSAVTFSADTVLSGCTYGSMYLHISCTVKRDGFVIDQLSFGQWDDMGDGFSVWVNGGLYGVGGGLLDFSATCTHSFVYPQQGVNQYTTNTTL